MPAPDFCDINSNFDSNVTVYESFVRGRDYVLRMVVTGWELEVPASHKLLSLAMAVAGLPAVCNELGLYQVKSVLFRQVARFNLVGYFEPHDEPFGSGCSGNIIAGNDTWVVDLVFRAGINEKSVPAPENWISYLSSALAGNRGKPTVYLGGLVDLVSGGVTGASGPTYEKAVNFWSSIQPFWEMTQEPTDVGSKSWKARERSINQAPSGIAWNTPGYAGQNGIGIALGDAFDPSTIQPLQLTGTIQPVVPQPDPTKPVVTDPNDPAAWPKPPSVPVVVTDTNKAVAVVAGALLALAVSKVVLRW